MAQAFQDLLVWQRAIELTTAVYQLTQSFPKQEIYGLTSQVRRASVSVASNIAEGRGRLSKGEFKQFPGIAQGSNYEVQTQLIVAKRLGFGDPTQLGKSELLSIEVAKMLSALLASLDKKLEAKS